MRVATWLCVVAVTSLVACDDVTDSWERRSAEWRLQDACRRCLLGDRSSCARCTTTVVARRLVPYYARKRSAVSRSTPNASIAPSTFRLDRTSFRTMLRDPCLSVCLSATLVYCGQTVGWIKMPLGTELGLGPVDIVLHEDPATIDMDRQVRGLLCPFPWGAGSPSNTMSPGPGTTSVPSGILIHPAVWPQ